MRRLVDTVGVTGALTDEAQARPGPGRARRWHHLLGAGMSGEVATYEAVRADFANRYVATRATSHPRGRRGPPGVRRARPGRTASALAWWSKPYPGNFGDWISPMLVAHVSDANIRLQPVTRATTAPHLVSLGSIGRFIRPSSIVVGTGISRDDVILARSGPLRVRARADHRRGAAPVRRAPGQRLRRPGGAGVPGRPVERGRTNGRIAFVRHFSHADLPLAAAAGTSTSCAS